MCGVSCTDNRAQLLHQEVQYPSSKGVKCLFPGGSAGLSELNEALQPVSFQNPEDVCS
jgi:hypothetical protein